jgi:hypothetical protein
MKSFLLYLFTSISFYSFAQVPTAMPPEANAFYSNAINNIKPEIRDLVRKNAGNLKSNNADSLVKALKKNSQLANYKSAELEAVAVLIMIQASKNADADLKQLVLARAKNNSVTATEERSKNILNYKSNMAESISVLMQKLGPHTETLINNLR